MDKGLFRQQSLDHISSPEELHDYMRVTDPRLWMFLAVILALLVGFIVYASTIVVENLLPIKATVEFGEYYEERDGEVFSDSYMYLISYQPISRQEIVYTGMEVRLGDEKGYVKLISIADDLSDEEAVHLLIEMEDEESAGTVLVDSLSQRESAGTVLVDSLRQRGRFGDSEHKGTDLLS